MLQYITLPSDDATADTVPGQASAAIASDTDVTVVSTSSVNLILRVYGPEHPVDGCRVYFPERTGGLFA